MKREEQKMKDFTATYYTTEKSDSESSRKWNPTNSVTLPGAKMVSRKRQIFLGTVCAVGMHCGEGVEQVSCTGRDGTWIDL